MSGQCQVHFKNQPFKIIPGPLAISTKGCLCEGFFFFFLNSEFFSSFPRDMTPLKLTMTESEIQCDTELPLSAASLLAPWSLTKETENRDMRKIKGPPIRSQELIYFLPPGKLLWNVRVERLPIPFYTEMLSSELSPRAALVNSAHCCLKPETTDMEVEHSFLGKHMKEFTHFSGKMDIEKSTILGN